MTVQFRRPSNLVLVVWLNFSRLGCSVETNGPSTFDLTRNFDFHTWFSGRSFWPSLSLISVCNDKKHNLSKINENVTKSKAGFQDDTFDRSDWSLWFINFIGWFGNQSKRLITYMLIVFIWMLAIAATYPIYESTVYRVSRKRPVKIDAPKLGKWTTHKVNGIQKPFIFSPLERSVW